MELTWLHLSDLHWCDTRSGWDRYTVTETLLKDLADRHSRDGLCPNLLFFTGDLAFGASSDPKQQPQPDQFRGANEFLERICAQFTPPIPKDHVFLVPGNHDVDRGQVSPSQIAYLDDTNRTTADVERHINDCDAEWRGQIKRLDAYRSFLQGCGYGHLLADPERLCYGYRLALSRSVCIGIAGLNSAWSCCRDGEKGKLWAAAHWQSEVAKRQVEGVMLNIALMHHPGTWYTKAEADYWRELRDAWTFTLHGHEHLNWVEEVNGHVTVAAGACYDRSGVLHKQSGYNIVRLDLARGSGEVWLREYSGTARAWRNNEVPQHTDARGVWPIEWRRAPARLVVRDRAGHPIPKARTGHAIASPPGRIDAAVGTGWQPRNSFSGDDWNRAFEQARKRIWLLGHSMSRAVDRSFSGATLARRIGRGVDCRLVVLDPFGHCPQIEEIDKAVSRDMRQKILETLRNAVNIEKSVPVTGEVATPRISVGITYQRINNSIVIIDDLFILTLYTHEWEFGDQGMTQVLNRRLPSHEAVCLSLERDFLWHWYRSRAHFDESHALPRVELRILHHLDEARRSTDWLDGGSEPLPPPYLAVIYPTYRCRHGKGTAPLASGPYADRLLCANCMYGRAVRSNGGVPEMTIDEFQRLCGQLAEYGVKTIELSGGGEPLHHAHASELLRTLRETCSNQAKGLITSIAGLHSCTLIPDMLRTFSYVRWSWPENSEADLAASASYRQALRSFVEARNQDAPALRVGVKLLVTKRNCIPKTAPPIVSVVEELLKLGIDHVKVRAIRCPAAGGACEEANEDDLRFLEDAFARAIDRFHNLGLLGNGSQRGSGRSVEVDIKSRLTATQAAYRCKLSTLFALIDPRGNLRMCWNDTRDGNRAIGNVFTTPFADLWGNQRHRQVCQEMRPGAVCDAPGGCHCRVLGYQDAMEHESGPRSVRLVGKDDFL